MGATINSFDTLGIQPNSMVYYRSYATPSKGIVGFRKLYPKFELGKIHKILGKTSCLITSERTGKLVSRHISDVFAFCPSRYIDNLPFTENLRRRVKEERGDDLEMEDIARELKCSKKAVGDVPFVPTRVTTPPRRRMTEKKGGESARKTKKSFCQALWKRARVSGAQLIDRLID